MNERTERLRKKSLAAIPSISSERAEITTAFYQEHQGRHSIPVLRALNFLAICEQKTLWMGEGELIVGERGPRPKAVPTYPELTCHSVEDLRILDSRERTQYKVEPGVIETYEREIIPFWKNRSMRDQMFQELHEPRRCRRFGYAEAAPGNVGFKVFRVGSPPMHCFWETYCPFTVHFYSARYRLTRLQETGKNDCMVVVIAFVYAAEMLS